MKIRYFILILLSLLSLQQYSRSFRASGWECKMNGHQCCTSVRSFFCPGLPEDRLIILLFLFNLYMSFSPPHHRLLCLTQKPEEHYLLKHSDMGLPSTLLLNSEVRGNKLKTTNDCLNFFCGKNTRVCLKEMLH